MAGGALGDRVTLCGIQCDGWVISPDTPDCKRCVAIHEINNLPAIEEQHERSGGFWLTGGDGERRYISFTSNDPDDSGTE